MLVQPGECGRVLSRLGHPAPFVVRVHLALRRYRDVCRPTQEKRSRGKNTAQVDVQLPPTKSDGPERTTCAAAGASAKTGQPSVEGCPVWSRNRPRLRATTGEDKARAGEEHA